MSVSSALSDATSDLPCSCNRVGKSGPVCRVCGVTYHPSCAEKKKKCCGVPLSFVVECDDSQVEPAYAFINSNEFKVVVSSILETQLTPLLNEIKNLRMEVEVLKNSNVDLIRLFGKNPYVEDDISRQLPLHNAPSRSWADEVQSVSDNKSNFLAEKTSNIPISKKVASRSADQKLKTPEVSVPSRGNSSIVRNRIDLPNIRNVDKDQNGQPEAVITKLSVVDSDGFQSVAYRRNRRKVIRGKASNADTSVIKAAVHKAHAYVGNLSIGTNSSMLSDYLRKTFPDAEFIVSDLPKRPDAMSVSFKVTMDSDVFSKFLNEDMWPENIIVKRFYFLKEKAAPTKIL
ncbi:hypothetical protein Zmor_018671 [Zophobas morio]|uniref:Uncharacterized protein n=1 Tax=Zophobas morio TaxID=2755281 RepID=A0AA38MDX6_9CUCU|nr:hypothetical protein Zmor_018671 [Zophobas morio]